MVKYKFFLIDVFTSEPFSGNPLAVFPEAEKIPENNLQKIAREMNLSETTFIFPPENKNNDIKIRIFTPMCELPFAGHPTIGSAFAVFSNLQYPEISKSYHIIEEGIGTVKVAIQWQNREIKSISMEQPLPEFKEIINDIGLISSLLSISDDKIVNDLPVQVLSAGLPTLYIPVNDIETLNSIQLRIDIWKKHFSGNNPLQIMAFTTNTGKAKNTVQSRFFAPALGVYEDPATGSASGPLGCYLLKYKLMESKEHLSITNYQGEKIQRPSKIFIEINQKNGWVESLNVGGSCVFVGMGEIITE